MAQLQFDATHVAPQAAFTPIPAGTYLVNIDDSEVKPTKSGGQMVANVVGPVCETGDTFATARPMGSVEAGDLVVFRTAGAYGATMANTYNSRALVPEVMVDGNRWSIVARRIEPAAILEAEQVPDWLA